MDYYKVLKNLGVDDDVLKYIKEFNFKFYKIKEEIDKYGEEIFILFYSIYKIFYKNIDLFYKDYK